MTPFTVSGDWAEQDDPHISLSGPEGYVCMDPESAKSAGRALMKLAEAMEEVEE